MEKSSGKPNFARLKALRAAALALGALVFAGTGWQIGVFTRPEVATVVLAFAFASIAYSASFYFGALLTEGSLQKYILCDETVIKDETVDMVTHTAPSGDDETDRWVKTYVFARNLFGLSLLPLAILGYLFFFS